MNVINCCRCGGKSCSEASLKHERSFHQTVHFILQQWVSLAYLQFVWTLLKQHRLVATCTPCCAPCHLNSLAGGFLSACCCAHLVFCEPPRWGVDAKLLQRVDDLASWADGDGAVEDIMQMVDAGILSAEREGTESVSTERENPIGG